MDKIPVSVILVDTGISFDVRIRISYEKSAKLELFFCLILIYNDIVKSGYELNERDGNDGNGNHRIFKTIS